jgi:ATP-binding cassette subfamily C protein CydC
VSNRTKVNLALGLPRDGFFKAGLIVAVLQGLSAVALLGVSAWLISRAAEVNSIVYLGLAIVGVRGFAVGRATFRYVERLLLHESAFRMLGERRPQIFAKLAPFIPAGLSKQSRGEIIARIVNDVDELQNLPLRVISPLVQAVAVASLSVVFVFALLPAAGLALLLSLLLGFIVAIPISAKFSRISDETIAPLKSRLSEQSLDILENQELYLAFGWMETRRNALAATDRKLRKALAKTAVSNGFGLSLFSLLTTIAMISGAWFGGHAVEFGAVPGAQLAVFMLLPMAIFEIAQSAQPAASAFRKFQVSASRINELLNRVVPPELEIAAGAEVFSEFQSLELSNVSITYPDSQQPVVAGFNLRLLPGEVVVLSGPSGAGKSSVALALCRLLNLSAGTYELNNRPVANFSLDSVRSRIGLVEQNPMIFIGNLRANLLFAKPEANDSKLIEVLSSVGLWQMFVNRGGLDTELGDRGVLVSGGEAQRLALARAILAGFKVLILDEPTANVDRETADGLLHELLRVANADDRAVVLITHEARYRSLANREIRF